MVLPVMVAPPARDAAIASLSELLGDRLSTAESVRQQHGHDASYHPCAPPDAVAFAESTEEVSEIVKICARHEVPIRNHEGKRPVAQSGLTGWARYSHGAPSAEVLGRLRPDPALRRLRGNARGVHRGDGPAPWHSGRDFGGDVLFPQRRSRSEHRNANHPGGDSGGAHGAGRRDSNGGNH